MKHIVAAAAIAALMFLPGVARADTISIDQYFSSAPNVFGSPSWSGYLGNAMASLQTAPGSSMGTPGTPSYYTTLGSTFTAADIMVTSFPSWQGVANPPPPFSGEYGNRLHAGVVITDIGGTFSLSDVSFAMHSGDAIGNFLDPSSCASGIGGSLCWENNLAGTTFNGTRIGINFGVDGIAGTADDVLCDISQPCTDSTALNELFYVGDGNAEWPGGNDPDPSNPLLGRQGAIDGMRNLIDGTMPWISNEYCVKGVCETQRLVNADFAVPEPRTITIFGAGLIALLFLNRRRRSFLRSAA